MFPLDRLQQIETPFYYYDKELLRATLASIKGEIAKYPNFKVHYAIKANANVEVLKLISKNGGTGTCFTNNRSQQ